mgnify:CR=1 FL=1
MKILITVKTGKGSKSTRKEIDKTVDVLIDTAQILQKKLKGFKEGKCKIYQDGTSMTLKR